MINITEWEGNPQSGIFKKIDVKGYFRIETYQSHPSKWIISITYDGSTEMFFNIYANYCKNMDVEHFNDIDNAKQHIDNFLNKVKKLSIFY